MATQLRELTRAAVHVLFLACLMLPPSMAQADEPTISIVVRLEPSGGTALLEGSLKPRAREARALMGVFSCQASGAVAKGKAPGGEA
jgi:hypothetical protein